MKVIKYMIAYLLLGAFVLFTSCSDDDDSKGDTTTDGTIQIGLLVSLTGTNQEVGRGARRGATLAMEEINEGGGIFGKEIKLLVKDTESNREVAVEKTEELLQENIIGIIGAWESSTTIAVSELIIPAEMTQVAYGATSPDITNIDDNGLLWRTAPSDVFQGKIAAEEVYAQGKRTASVVFVDNAYGRGLANAFKVTFEDLGGTVLWTVGYPELSEVDIDAYDYRPIVDSLFLENPNYPEEKPDVINLMTYTKDGTKISLALNQYIEEYPDLTFFGGDGISTQDFVSNAAPEVVERLQGSVPIPVETDDNYIAYKEAYTTRFNEDPPVFSEGAYDAVYVLVYAMLVANSEISSELASQLITISQEGELVNVNEFATAKSLIEAGTDIDYDGASGKIDFDANGDVTSGAYGIWTVEDEELVIMKTVVFP